MIIHIEAPHMDYNERGSIFRSHFERTACNESLEPILDIFIRVRMMSIAKQEVHVIL